MTNDDQWQRRCARGRQGKMLHQEAGKKTDQLRWSTINDYLMSRDFTRFVACLSFANFRPRLNSGLQEYKGNKVPTYRITRAQGSSMSLLSQLHDFLPQTLSTKCHIFSCFRDGGKRFDAEFQGSHHQLDKQEIFHMISKWKQRCKMNKKNV